jgi:hypothetical protein
VVSASHSRNGNRNTAMIWYDMIRVRPVLRPRQTPFTAWKGRRGGVRERKEEEEEEGRENRRIQIQRDERELIHSNLSITINKRGMGWNSSRRLNNSSGTRGTGGFISVFTKICHWTLPRV